MQDYNVFICYRGNEGGVFAANIYSELRLHVDNQIKIFFAPRCVPHGANFKTACLKTAGGVALVIMILTVGFFDGCANDDDIVYGELKNALKNENTQFLPIIMPDFDFKTVDLSLYFEETEIDRIKHISAIKFTDVYSFSSTDMLIPILKDKIGIVDYVDALTNKEETFKGRVYIGEEGKKDFFADNNLTEKKRLQQQQRLLQKFDLPVYEKLLYDKENINLLDFGCGNGKALMTRVGDRKEIAKIIGLEYDKLTAENANKQFGSDSVKFYCCDVESEDFGERLEEIMEENDIDGFDFVNSLAVLSHLKQPFKVLRTIKKYCHKKAAVLVRTIDDGLNVCYPDDDGKFERALSFLHKCQTTGYRRSGREVYTLLKRAGYKNIALEKAGLNSVRMDYDEKSAFFDVIFKFIKQGLVKTTDLTPDDAHLKADLNWFLKEYDNLEEKFLSDDFFMNFGFVLFTAET